MVISYRIVLGDEDPLAGDVKLLEEAITLHDDPMRPCKTSQQQTKVEEGWWRVTLHHVWRSPFAFASMTPPLGTWKRHACPYVHIKNPSTEKHRMASLMASLTFGEKSVKYYAGRNQRHNSSGHLVNYPRIFSQDSFPPLFDCQFNFSGLSNQTSKKRKGRAHTLGIWISLKSRSIRWIKQGNPANKIYTKYYHGRTPANYSRRRKKNQKDGNLFSLMICIPWRRRWKSKFL